MSEPAVLLVRADHVLTSGPAGDLRDGAVAVSAQGLILAVGPYPALRARYPAVPVEGDGTGVLTPGFVNCHGHFSEGLVSGIGETHTLWEWFTHVVGPIEPHLTREMAFVGTLLKGAEMAVSGVTTVADMFCFAPGPEPVVPGVVDALEQLGLRGDVSYGPADDPNPRPLEVVLAEHAALEAAAAASRRCTFRVGLATVPTSSDELIRATADLVARVGRLHVHLNEVREEVTASRTTRGVGSIELASRTGLLEGSTLAAHCVWLDDPEIDLLLRHEVAVAHNPVSNMILASGVAPVPRLRREGVTVGLGLDGAASNDSQDMLGTLKTAALLQKVHHLQATALTAPAVFEMATIGGARALGLSGSIGSLEPGKAADLVLFHGRTPAMANIHDPYQKVVYCAGPADVAAVRVGGDLVARGGRVVDVDLAEIYPRAEELAIRLATDAGLTSALNRR